MGKRVLFGVLVGACLGSLGLEWQVLAGGLEEKGVLSTIEEEGTIRRLPDGSGKFLLVSDGYYCLDVHGGLHGEEGIHYFRDFVLDGVRLDGYYYHDASGQFQEEALGVLDLSGLSLGLKELEGCYYVGELGKLEEEAQVRYLDGLKLAGEKLEGYYYFDEWGHLDTVPGVHQVESEEFGLVFDGEYYFGGENGKLLFEEQITPDGRFVGSDGKLLNEEQTVVARMKLELEELLEGYEGTWSVYVKNLENQQEIVLNDTPVYPASVIKAFVMAKTYENLDQVLDNAALYVGDELAVSRVGHLLTDMITVSDNEAFNELVRLQNPSRSFTEGCREINEWLQEQGYENTQVAFTLHPSASAVEGLSGEENWTSVSDCGKLLDEIYRGTCVSEEASREMLGLLLNQQVTWKIPDSLPEGVKVANKTGETSDTQHDIAIVYGPETTYILCVLSEDCPSEGEAIAHIQEISRLVYSSFNSSADQGK